MKDQGNWNELRLIHASPEILDAILQGDEAIANHLDIGIATGWSAMANAIFPFVLEQLVANPVHQHWFMYLAIHPADNMLIGNGGFKGPPANNVVEIGYEIAESYRNRGFATEMVGQLIRLAAESNQVTCIMAHTIARENASVHVLKKCGFKYDGVHEDPEDGLVYKWTLPVG